MDYFEFDFAQFDQFPDELPTPPTTFGQALEAFLVDNLGVPAWCCHLPQQVTLPGLTYCLERRENFFALDRTTPLTSAYYYLDVFSNDRAETEAIAEGLRGLLEGYRGRFGGFEVSSFLENTEVKYEATEWGSDRGVFVLLQEFRFLYA